MRLYPGTHRRGVFALNLGDPSKPPIDRKEYAGIKPVVVDVKAGEGILINPLCLQASVPNRSNLTKFTLMIQVQDFTTVVDPDDPSDKLAKAYRTVAAAGWYLPEPTASDVPGETDTAVAS